jgi:hypothetical protein
LCIWSDTEQVVIVVPEFYIDDFLYHVDSENDEASNTEDAHQAKHRTGHSMEDDSVCDADEEIEFEDEDEDEEATIQKAYELERSIAAEK